MAAIIVYLSIVLAMVIGASSSSVLRATVYGALFSILVSVGIVVWYQSFFPHEGSADQMLEALFKSDANNAVLWIWRATYRALFAAGAGAAGYGIKRTIKRDRAATKT